MFHATCVYHLTFMLMETGEVFGSPLPPPPLSVCFLPLIYMIVTVNHEPLCNTAEGVVPSKFLLGMTVTEYKAEFLEIYENRISFW